MITQTITAFRFAPPPTLLIGVCVISAIAGALGAIACTLMWVDTWPAPAPDFCGLDLIGRLILQDQLARLIVRA